MSALPNCPKCNSESTYEDSGVYFCQECAHEWSATTVEAADEPRVVKDANGNVPQDGDTVSVTRDLKVKGSSVVVKVGTRVKNIRLVDGHHDIVISHVCAGIEPVDSFARLQPVPSLRRPTTIDRDGGAGQVVRGRVA